MAYTAPTKSTRNAAAAITYHTFKNGKIRDNVISAAINCSSIEAAPREFAEMRRFFGHKKGVEAYTDIISFPDGEVTMEQALDTACEAYSRAFPDVQFVATAQNDGRGGKIHVHLCKNNVSLVTGKRLNSSGMLNLLKSKVDEVCMERGLSVIELKPVMDTKYRSYSIQGRKRRYTTTEKSLHDTGKRSWKDEIRDAIDAAKKICKSEDEFFAVMKNKGIIVTNRAGGYTYRLEGHKAVRGKRLGDDYNETHLLNVFMDNRIKARYAAEPPKVVPPKPKPAYKPYKLTEAESIGLEILRGFAKGMSEREILGEFSKKLATGGETAHNRLAEASNQISRGKLCLPVSQEFLSADKKSLDIVKIKQNPEKFAKSMSKLAAKQDSEMIGGMAAALIPIPGVKSIIQKAVSKTAEGVLKVSYSQTAGAGRGASQGGQGLRGIKDVVTGEKDSHAQLIARAANNEPDDWFWLNDLAKDDKREEAARARTY